MSAEETHVLMTGDAVGGVWTYALDLARALGRHGIRITLATMGPLPSAEQMHAAGRIDNLQVVTSTYKLEWMDEPWHDVETAGAWLLNMEPQLAPDIVHLNGYAHGALPFTAAIVVAGHSCVLSWADAIPGAIDGHALAAYRARIAPGIRAARHVVAPSDAMLAALDRFYGPLPPASVIPNGRFAAPFGAAPKQPFVFTAGRLWDRAKNAEAVAAIAARLPWPVAMAGDQGSQGSQGSVSLPHVRMLGKLSEAEIAQVLARASIVALPARYEPFGLLAVEAALSGCALVLGDIPSLREVWDEAADFVHPDDHEQLYRAIRALIASPSRLAERAQAARRRDGMYTPERMADAYAGLYASLGAAAKRPRSIACAS
jgi:glycogen synthase